MVHMKAVGHFQKPLLRRVLFTTRKPRNRFWPLETVRNRFQDTKNILKLCDLSFPCHHHWWQNASLKCHPSIIEYCHQNLKTTMCCYMRVWFHETVSNNFCSALKIIYGNSFQDQTPENRNPEINKALFFLRRPMMRRCQLWRKRWKLWRPWRRRWRRWSDSSSKWFQCWQRLGSLSTQVL